MLSSTAEGEGTPPDALDSAVNAALVERLGKGKRVQFYLPNFVSWKGDDLLLAIGGATFVANVDPLEPYCYVLRINSSTLRVESIVSGSKLKRTPVTDVVSFLSGLYRGNPQGFQSIP